MKRLLFCITICMLLISCNRIKNAGNKVVGKVIDQAIDVMMEPTIKDYSLSDKFPEFKKAGFKINEIKGVKCEYFPPSFYKYYFKYSGDRELIQQYIAGIQCHYTEIVPDTILKESNAIYFERKTEPMTENELKKVKFFFEYKETDLNELKFYTCTKTPEDHFIIFDLKNNLIYHMIESFRE